MRTFFRRIEGWNGILLMLYCGVIFGLGIVLLNSFDKLNILGDFLVLAVILMLVCPLVIRFFKDKSIACVPVTSKAELTLLKIAFFVIPFSVFLVYYIAYFPGGFSYDTMNQYNQVLTNQYNDWHPVLQTLLAIKLPLLLTGGWIGSITLFQVISFSIVLSYMLSSILKHTNKLFAVTAMFYILLNPNICCCAMFAWKDVSFAILSALIMTFAMHIYFTKGKWMNKKHNVVLFVVIACVMTIVRHNAIIFTVPLLFAVALFLSRKKAFVVILCTIICFFMIVGPLYSFLDVEDPNRRQVEVLGLPMTVIGAVAKYDYDSLDGDTKIFVDNIAPKDVWDKYEYGQYNRVKFQSKTDNDVIEEYGAPKVIRMMLNCIVASPEVSLTALIKLTEVVYTVSDKYQFSILPYIDQAFGIGIEQQGVGFLKTLIGIYSNIMTKVFPLLFIFVGFIHLCLIITVLSKCKLNSFDDWKRILLSVPVFAYNFGTMLLLTGAEDSTRFFFYSFIIFPVLLTVFYSSENLEASL